MAWVMKVSVITEKGKTMYDSPIELFISEIQEKFESGIFEAVQRFDIDVNREELIRALKYDRDQYHKGFSDGRMSGRVERDEEIVRCADCIHYDTDTKFCEIHSHFITRDGEFCYPSESREWKMFSPDDFCSYGERRSDEQ